MARIPAAERLMTGLLEGRGASAWVSVCGQVPDREGAEIVDTSGALSGAHQRRLRPELGEPSRGDTSDGFADGRRSP